MSLKLFTFLNKVHTSIHLQCSISNKTDVCEEQALDHWNNLTIFHLNIAKLPYFKLKDWLRFTVPVNTIMVMLRCYSLWILLTWYKCQQTQALLWNSGFKPFPKLQAVLAPGSTPISSRPSRWRPINSVKKYVCWKKTEKLYSLWILQYPIHYWALSRQNVSHQVRLKPACSADETS